MPPWQDIVLGLVGVLSMTALYNAVRDSATSFPLISSLSKILAQAGILSVNISLGYWISTAFNGTALLGWLLLATLRRPAKQRIAFPGTLKGDDNYSKDTDYYECSMQDLWLDLDRE